MDHAVFLWRVGCVLKQPPLPTSITHFQKWETGSHFEIERALWGGAHKNSGFFVCLSRGGEGGLVVGGALKGSW